MFDFLCRSQMYRKGKISKENLMPKAAWETDTQCELESVHSLTWGSFFTDAGRWVVIAAWVLL